jgi:ketosteroid isomerase-like protein
MPSGILGTAYEALGRGDSGPLLALIDADFEWVEPDLPGYPLAGVHQGPDGVGAVLTRLATLLDGLVIEGHEVAEAGERETVTGVMRGRPAGAEEDWELPFAHVWELDGDGRVVRVRAYFDRSRLTLAAARRQLAEVTDDLLEQAAEIRRQWARLGDALRAAGVEAPEEAVEALAEADGDGAAVPVGAGTASARLAAVDMAQDGATREEVETYLRDDAGVEDPASILDEVFGASAEPTETPLAERGAGFEAPRLGRLFARNRG